MKKLVTILSGAFLLISAIPETLAGIKTSRPGVFPNSEKYSITQSGLSGTAVIKTDRIALSQTEDMDGHFDSYFYKHDHFVFGRRGDRLYFNFYDKGNWVAYIDSPVDFHLKPGKIYHLAFTAKVHKVSESGELWTDIVIYVNGSVVRHYRGYNQLPQINGHPVQAGKADGFGKGWDFHGSIFEAELFQRVLTDAEIRKMVKKDKRITPAFETVPKIPKNKKKALSILRKNAKKYAEPERSRQLALIDGVEVLLRSNETAAADTIIKNFPSAAISRDKILDLFDNGDSILIFVNIPGKKYLPAVWFDRSAGRNVLNGLQSDIFKIFIQTGKQNSTVTARTAGVISSLTGFKKIPPEKYTFDIKFDTPDLIAKTTFTLNGKRLSYTLDAAGKTPQTKITKVNFPAVRLNNFADISSSVLLIPRMSGAAVPDPVNSRFNYSAFYPSGFASMQLGAWYDKTGGVYFAVEDPIACSKMLSFATSPEALLVDYIWPSALKTSQGIWHFAPAAPAVMELFRGNWFEAGNIYRKFIENSAVWGKTELKETPQWLKNNSLWLSMFYDERTFGQVDKLLKYLGTPFAIHYYGWCGKFDRDYPQHRGDPESFTVFEELKKRGIHVVPYTNGRLWELHDRRDEDFEYSKYGFANAVKDPKGKITVEGYRNVSFAVMCPAAPGWQKTVADFVGRILNYGVRGVYLDQIAASRWLLCFDKNHPHAPGAVDAWYNQGYRPMLQNIRKKMLSEHPGTILASEDAAEPYVGLCDALLPWRYMANHYVPLFQHCYWGKVQLFGRAGGGDEKLAWNFKFANQLVNNEQLGWISLEGICRNYRKETRQLLKAAMYVRQALKNYFFNGSMARPVDFKNLKHTFLHCGVNNLNISVPLIESGTARLGNREIFIFVNPGNQPQQAQVIYDHRRRNTAGTPKLLHQFSSHIPDVSAAYPADFIREIKLAPREIQIWLIGEKDDPAFDSDAKKLSKEAALWQSFQNDKDPFTE